MHNINNFSLPTIQLPGFTSYPSGGEFSLLTITMTPHCDIEAGLRHSRFENNPRVGTSKSCFLTTHNTRTHTYFNYNDNNNKHAWCFVNGRRKSEGLDPGLPDLMSTLHVLLVSQPYLPATLLFGCYTLPRNASLHLC
jgi:hypothetical protein